MTSVLDNTSCRRCEGRRESQRLLTAAPLGVAFSGGVDSSVLLALAARTLGPDQVVAILGVSPSLGTADRNTRSPHISMRLAEVQTSEGEAKAYRVNGPDRCHHCKTEPFTRIALELGLLLRAAQPGRGPHRPSSVVTDRVVGMAAVSRQRGRCRQIGGHRPRPGRRSACLRR